MVRDPRIIVGPRKDQVLFLTPVNEFVPEVNSFAVRGSEALASNLDLL